jgi:hypothetical protein
MDVTGPQSALTRERLAFTTHESRARGHYLERGGAPILSEALGAVGRHRGGAGAGG